MYENVCLIDIPDYLKYKHIYFLYENLASLFLDVGSIHFDIVFG